MSLRTLLSALLICVTLAACGVRGDPKPLDPKTTGEAQ
jgi:predicted small lipoprotein YifL